MEKQILAFAHTISNTNPLLAYIFFFINSVLQVVFPPYPGDSVAVFQGYLSSIGVLNSTLLFLSAFAGTLVSSLFVYMVSYKFGEKLIKLRYIKKFFDTEKIYKLRDWFNKYGAVSIIINKFVPGMGTIILIAAGVFKLKYLPAVISIIVASLLRSGFLFMTGRLTGENIQSIKNFFIKYQILIILILLILSAIYVYFKYLHKKKNPN